MASGKSTGQLPADQILGVSALFLNDIFAFLNPKSKGGACRSRHRLCLSVEKSDRASA